MGRRAHLFLVVSCGVYLCLLLLSRLLGILPGLFVPLSMAAIPAVALSGAMLTRRRPGRRGAARAVDRSAGTDDLFLTAASLPARPGEYAPLVVQAAEARSRKVAPPSVVPLRWYVGARNSMLALGAVALSVYFVPTLDPFGYKETRERSTRRRRELKETRKATELRRAQLEKARTEGLSPPVERALEDLKTTLRQMKPKESGTNLERMGKHQQELGKLWRKTGEELLPTKSGTALGEQSFGLRSPLAATWSKQLSQGKTAAFRSEMAKLKELAKKLGEATDPAERERLRRELKRRMKEAARFASEAMGSQGLQSALGRAMAQMNMGQAADLFGQALEGMLDSLELAGQELGMIEQALEDLQALEDALKTLQMAQQANRGKGLNGEDAAGCDTMADYAELYESLMAQGRQPGAGPGMQGPGRGEGNEAPEDDNQDTGHKREMSGSSLTAGEILLQWQIDETAEPGTVHDGYRQRLRQVKQGVDEAIVRERIPPGYHDGIRKYFDKLGEPGEAAVIRDP